VNPAFLAASNNNAAYGGSGSPDQVHSGNYCSYRVIIAVKGFSKSCCKIQTLAVTTTPQVSFHRWPQSESRKNMKIIL